MKSKFFGCLSFLAGVCLVKVVVLTASCNKHNQSAAGNENICVIRLSPMVSDYGVSGANLDSIHALFSANNLSTSNFQFQGWQTDTEVNVDPGAYNGYQEQIAAIQFFNGLPVFADEAYFTFDAGKFQPSDVAAGYTGPAPTADTAGHQTLADLRTAFLAKVPQSYTAGGPANAKPFIPSASTYINSCLNVTLGYLDASMIPGNTTAFGKALIKVWSVTPSMNSSITYYPLVYVEDGNGFAWGVPFFVP